MKKLTVLAVSLLAAGIAVAESPTPDDTATYKFAEPKTRAQVLAETMQAKADGSISSFVSALYNPAALAKSTKTRAEVVAEVEAARGSGALDAFSGEDSGAAYLARLEAPRAAAPVLASVK